MAQQCGGPSPAPVQSMHSSSFVQGEVKLLLELLPRYTAHVLKHPHTLLIKFFGLYRVTPANGAKARQYPQHPACVPPAEEQAYCQMLHARFFFL